MAAKTLSTQASSEEISSDDLLIEILHRLPIRSLIRFQFISKHWESLIKSPIFCKLIRYPNRIPATGLFVPWSYITDKPIAVQGIRFDVKNPKTSPRHKLNIKLIQSCNGLLLGSINSEYHVYNPTTNKSFTLPAVGKTNKWWEPDLAVCSMSLAFDPNESPYYKVVCVLKKSKSVFYVHIYSSETRVWTSNGERYDRDVNLEGVYWNGCVHWFTAETYFDIKNQRMEKLPMPPYLDWRDKYYFGESFGHLHYARIYPWEDEMYHDDISVWELLPDHSGWIFKYRLLPDVDFQPASGGSLFEHYPAKSVLSVIRGEEEGDAFVVIEMDTGEVLRYNIVSKTYEILHNFRRIISCNNTFQYIESLSCV